MLNNVPGTGIKTRNELPTRVGVLTSEAQLVTSEEVRQFTEK